MQRLAAALRAPGIDPRLWLTLAVVRELGVDPEHGVFADLSLVPTGDKETALVGSGYTGDGYGVWAPLQKDDLVLVAIPRGDPAMGPVIISRLWSGSEKPPAELGASNGADPPTSPVIVVGPGQTLKVICRPGASVEVSSDTPAAVPVSLSAPADRNWDRLQAVFQTWVPVATDGGAALKLLLTQLLAGSDPPVGPAPNLPWPEPTAAERLRGE